MKMVIEKIIGGGQSGGDIAGAMFAVKHSIPVDINICKNFVPVGRTGFPNEIVSKISNVNVVTQKTGIPGLIERTKYNVVNSDFTIIVIDRPFTLTKGTFKTIGFCTKHRKAYLMMYVEGKEHLGRPQRHTTLELDEELHGPLSLEIYYPWLLFEAFRSAKERPSMGFIINIAGPRDLDEELGVQALEKMFIGR